MAAPNSYKDPYWADLSGKVEQKLGLPGGLLTGVLVNGERSNADQVSEANAKTPFQIIPATQQAAIKKWGIDPYLSPENAAEVAGLLLKDSLQRNKGDERIAIAEYHGGTDRSNWGPRTKAYVDRVAGGQEKTRTSALDNDFARWMQAHPAVPAPAAAAEAKPQQADPLAQDFGSWFEQKRNAPAPAPAQELGILGSIKESVTGAARRTPETEAAPDWAAMPELNEFSVASAKTGLGTLLSNPAETVQIIQANFPGVAVRQDEKGNYFLKSGVDGQEYAIKPGFRPSDIPRAAGALAAFTPAGGARTIAGSALASAGTQTAIEATQSMTGGEMNPGDIAIAGAMGGAVPAVANAVRAGVQPAKQAIARARGVPEPMPAAPASASPVAPVAAPPAAPAAVMTGEELAATAKTASGGGMGSTKATQSLAGQAAPDAKVVDAAKRLGIEDHLQPDHVTTNQAYRELAQAVKSIPGSEARAAEMTGLEQVAKRADDLVDELGGTRDVSTLNATVKARMQTTVMELEKRADDLYDELRQAIPAKTPAAADSTVGFLKQHADELGGAERLLPVERKLLEALNGEDGPLTYAFLDQTRKQIGQAMRKASGPFKDSESGMLKKLYSSLADDQAVVAEANGASDLYRAASAAVRVRKGLEDDIVSLFGKELDKTIVGDLAGGVRALSAGDTSKFLGLLKAVPQESRQSIVASGLASAFKTAGTRGPINFNTYAKWYEGLLRNKQAYAALMSNLPPQARKQLSDLYRVSKSISSATRERITTGRIQAVQDQFKEADTLAGRLYEVAQRGAVGAVAGTVAAPVVGPGAAAAIASALTKGAKPNALKATDALISSPEFVKLAKAAGTPSEPAAARALAYSKAFNRYVRALGNPREMSNRERWILQSMQINNNGREKK